MQFTLETDIFCAVVLFVVDEESALISIFRLVHMPLGLL